MMEVGGEEAKEAWASSLGVERVGSLPPALCAALQPRLASVQELLR